MPRLLHFKKSHPEESVCDHKYSNCYNNTIIWVYSQIFQLGFNIRGGVLYFSNIFVSKVYPDTLAYRNGLNEGDQIVSVNGIDFRIINHFEAVKIFKENAEFLIVVKYSPYGKPNSNPASIK